VPAGHLFKISSHHSGGLDCPETTPPEDLTVSRPLLLGSAISRSIPSVLSKKDTTNPLDHRLHLWRVLCRQLIHISNVQQLLSLRRLLQKLAEITLAIKSSILAVVKKSQRANHTVTWILMNRTSYDDSQGIYTLRGGPKERRRKKNQSHSLLYQRLKIESSSVDFTVTLWK